MTIKVCLIGAGNVAWHLTNRLSKSETVFVQVVGKNATYIPDAALSSKNIRATKDNSQIIHDADFYILCVPDDAITDAAAKIPFKLSKDQTLLHTSGAVSSDVLSPFAQSFGVIWPVQSFIKKIETINNNWPVIISGPDKATIDKIKLLAQQLTKYVTILSDIQKSDLHLAAVIVNNFINHLFVLTNEFCTSRDIPFHLLNPLISETVKKLQFNDAEHLQTGPAKRNDKLTIEKHTMVLDNYPELLEIYTLFTSQLQKKYHPL